MDYSFETNYNIVMCASSKHLIDHAHKMIKSSAGAQIKTMCVMDTKNNVFTLITFTDYIHLCFSVLFRFVERLLHRKELVPFTQLVKVSRGKLVLALPSIRFS